MKGKQLLLTTGIITLGGISLLNNKYSLEKNYYYKSIEKTNYKQANKIYETILDVDELKDDYSFLYEENIEGYINHYADVYEINREVVYNKIAELTNDFKDYPWTHLFMINGVSYKNTEQAILYTVRDIYRNPSNYNLESEDLKRDVEYETDTYCEDLVLKYCDLLDVNKEVAMAICYAECGSNLNSYNYINNHNPAGIGPYNYYKNIEHGVIEYIFLLKNGYGCTLDTNSSFFYTMGPIYCTEGYENWISMTNSYYNNLLVDYYYYAYNRGYQKVLK